MRYDKKRIQFDLQGDDLKTYKEVLDYIKTSTGIKTTYIQKSLFMQAVKIEFEKLKNNK